MFPLQKAICQTRRWQSHGPWLLFVIFELSLLSQEQRLEATQPNQQPRQHLIPLEWRWTPLQCPKAEPVCAPGLTADNEPALFAHLQIVRGAPPLASLLVLSWAMAVVATTWAQQQQQLHVITHVHCPYQLPLYLEWKFIVNFRRCKFTVNLRKF